MLFQVFLNISDEPVAIVPHHLAWNNDPSCSIRFLYLKGLKITPIMSY